MCMLQRQKHCFCYAILAEALPKFFIRQLGEGFYLTSFRKHISTKSVHERSILAVHINSKIQTVQGTNQNAPFHSGPVQPYNTM